MRFFSFKFLNYSACLMLVIAFSGCSLLFPSPKKKLQSIESKYIQTQLKFDRTLENSFTNSQIDSLKESYEELYEDVNSLLEDIDQAEKEGKSTNIDKELVEYYRLRIQNKVVICGDLKD